MSERKKALALLIGTGRSGRLAYHYLAREFDVRLVVQEAPVGARRLLARRIKRLGYRRVADQVLFRALAVPLLETLAAVRKERIVRMAGLVDTPIPTSIVTKVASVNDMNVPALIARAEVDAVGVFGTRIISKRILSRLTVPAINVHAGITPTYRGVHGGWWAMYEGRPELCGVTVHRVDSGIDTGPIVGQTTIEPTASDNFATYPLLQLVAGLELLAASLREDRLEGRPSEFPNAPLRYHPGLSEYIAGCARGVR